MDSEKVKKRLACCIRNGENAEVRCSPKYECPYEITGFPCWLELNKDALDLIEELEERIAIMTERSI